MIAWASRARKITPTSANTVPIREKLFLFTSGVLDLQNRRIFQLADCDLLQIFEESKIFLESILVQQFANQVTIG